MPITTTARSIQRRAARRPTVSAAGNVRRAVPLISSVSKKGRPDLKREAVSPASAVRRCVRQKLFPSEKRCETGNFSRRKTRNPRGFRVLHQPSFRPYILLTFRPAYSNERSLHTLHFNYSENSAHIGQTGKPSPPLPISLYFFPDENIRRRHR